MAIAVAALDVGGTGTFPEGVEIVLAPVDGSPPLGLTGNGARVWRSLIGSTPVPASRITDADRTVLWQLEALGLACVGPAHPAMVRRLERPRLFSPTHELVNGLVAYVARQSGIRCVVIKGPALHRQGIRDRAHSGDVDVWCEPSRWTDLIDALELWGWRREPDPWFGTAVNHSATLVPSVWGCEIDVHRRVPGMVLDDAAAFEVVVADTEVELYAGVPVHVPSPARHAVIAALHAARPEVGRGARTDDEVRACADLLRRVPHALNAVSHLGAAPALHAEIAVMTGNDPASAAVTGVPRDWLWRAEPNRARAYLRALREQPLSERARLLFRLVWPAADVAVESARRAGDPVTGPLRARVRRLRRGAREWLSSAHPCVR